MYSQWGNRLVESQDSFTVQTCDQIAGEFGRLFAPLAAAGRGGPGDLRYQHVKSVNDQLEQWHSEILGQTQRTYQASHSTCQIQFCNVADPGSGAFLPLDPGSDMEINQDPVSGMNIPDHISESLGNSFLR
jgi:hypothetical protein